MGSRVTFGAKYAGETVLLPFDFTSRLSPGETISTEAVTASVYSGSDPTPNGIVQGAPSVSGAIVKQAITGGVVGVVYELLCTVTTSLSQTLELSGYLPLVTDLI